MGTRNVLGLAHAFRFFSENGFLSIVSHKGASALELPSHYMYGSNGGLLRHNFLNEWFKANVAGSEKVSLVVPPLMLNPAESTLRSSLSEGCRKFYEQVSHTHDERLPFGIAATGTCVDPDVSKETVLGMPRPMQFHECIVHHYVTEKLVSDLFHKTEVDHLMWWKNLSNSKEFHSRRNEESDSLSSSIIYSSVHGDTATETLQVSGPLTDLPKSPFVIESRVVTDIAMMVLLHDGFSETNLDGKDIQKLKFHRRLAPYKLGIMFSCEDYYPDLEESLQLVADYITGELKSEGILIQTQTNGSKNSRLFQTGVPYAVILTKKTLDDGIVHLKDPDSLSEEEVHVTQLKEKIMKFVRAS